MLAYVHSAALSGVEAYPVGVEVNVASGLPGFSLVGLPEGAVREARERVIAALSNSGHRVPPRRVTVNLTPADRRKGGAALDLPVAVGLLAATGVIPSGVLDSVGFYGELGLDGSLREVRGTLAAATAFRDRGLLSMVVPGGVAEEAALLESPAVYGAASLTQVIEHLTGARGLPRVRPAAGEPTFPERPSAGALETIRGQEIPLRALEIAAAGGHNLLLAGPPGAGKTLLARALADLLPDLDRDEALEVTRIHSAAGLLPADGRMVRARPFRAPHHTVSHVGLLGGGAHLGPGEVTLAHRGVLFLDELPEFSRRALEGLRQPMESGVVRIARAAGRIQFPARFTLVGAMNPCPCGHHGDEDSHRTCRCSPTDIRRYAGRVSGPLMDRIDLHVHVRPVPPPDLFATAESEVKGAEVRDRVRRSRALQVRRYQDLRGVRCNGDLPPDLLDIRAGLGREGKDVLVRAADRLGLSARSCHRAIRVARTIADLDGEEAIGRRAVLEAVFFRGERP